MNGGKLFSDLRNKGVNILKATFTKNEKNSCISILDDFSKHFQDFILCHSTSIEQNIFIQENVNNDISKNGYDF